MAAVEGACLYFIGNEIEIIYTEYADRGFKAISDYVVQFPGSRMVRGNHDSLEYIGAILYAGKMFDFESLPICSSGYGVAIAHNIDNIVHPELSVISTANNLSKIVFLEAERVAGKQDCLGHPFRKEQFGKVFPILKSIPDKTISLPSHQDYLRGVVSAFARQGIDLAFVGHEHNIDKDSTIWFELGNEYGWGILSAEEKVHLKPGLKYIFVSPHFRGETHARLAPEENATHYLTYETALKEITYLKLARE